MIKNKKLKQNSNLFSIFCPFIPEESAEDGEGKR